MRGSGKGTIVGLCSALLARHIKGGLIIVGGLNLGGSLEPIYNAVNIVEIAAEKGATTVMMPVSSRKQLYDLSDDMATKVDVKFYSDVKDCLLKAIME